MAEIGHALFEQTTAQTTTSASFVTVSGCTLSGLSNSSDYLLLFLAYIGGADVNSDVHEFQVEEDGVGAISGSYVRIEPESANTSRGHPYLFMARVTTAAVANSYNLQFATLDGSSTTHCAGAWGLALKIGDLTENTDFFYDEDLTNLNALSSSGWTDGASITIGNGSDNYLVISFGYCNGSNSAYSIYHTIDVNSTEHSEIRIETEDNQELYCFGAVTYLAAPSASTVVKNKFQTTQAAPGGALDVTINRIFALNLSAFEDSGGARETTAVDLPSTDTTVNIENLAITTNTQATEDWFFIGFSSVIQSDISAGQRFQLYDNTSATTIAGVETGATAPQSQGHATSSRLPITIFGELASVADNTSLNVDYHMQEDSNAGTDAGQISLVGFTWELFADAISITVPTGPWR